METTLLDNEAVRSATGLTISSGCALAAQLLLDHLSSTREACCLSSVNLSRPWMFSSTNFQRTFSCSREYCKLR